MRFYDPQSDRVFVGRIIAAFVGVLILAYAIAAVGWGIGVGTSGIFGRGEQIKHVNSEDNRTFAQEYFEELYADIIAYDQQITVYEADKDRSEREEVELTGLKLQCLNAANEYNAEARKVTSAPWRSADLPPQIDLASPSTDCEGDRR